MKKLAQRVKQRQAARSMRHPMTLLRRWCEWLVRSPLQFAAGLPSQSSRSQRLALLDNAVRGSLETLELRVMLSGAMTVQTGLGHTQTILALPGSNVTATVQVTDNAAGLTSADLVIHYDPAVLTMATDGDGDALGVALSAQLSGWGLTTYVPSPGTINVGFFSTAGALTTGPHGLLTLTFAVPGSDADGASSTLNVTPAVASGLNGGAITMLSDNGSITIDAPLTSTPADLHPPVATEGAPVVNAVLFHFADSYPVNDVATVTWGDGAVETTATSPNVSLVPSGNGFDVIGSHTYLDELSNATFSVSVSDALSTTSQSINTFTVADAALTDTSSALSASATEGQATGPLTLATFTDANPGNHTADFTATIHWGDNSTSSGAVTYNAGAYTVTGSHTYADERATPFAVTVDVSDIGSSTLTAIGQTSVTVQDAALTGSSSATATGGIEGTTVATLANATFTDANPGDHTADFTATIDWGDNTTSPGVVTYNGSAYTVAGTHLYAEEGSFYLTIAVTDDGGSTATITGSAIVADIAPPTVTAVYVASTQVGAVAGWSPSFYNFLASSGQGSSTLGYAMPTGANQLKTLPWTTINQFSIQFSTDVHITQNALAIIGINQTGISVGSFSYNAVTHVATWTLTAPLSRDKILLNLNSSAVTDWDNNALDGEWTNGASTVSGNGAAGGNFAYRLNIVPGDVNRDTGVNLTDTGLARSQQGATTTTPTYSIFIDVNGDGGNNLVDTGLVRSLQGSTLPAGEPQPVFTLSSFAPGTFSQQFLFPVMVSASAFVPPPTIPVTTPVQPTIPSPVAVSPAPVIAARTNPLLSLLPSITTKANVTPVPSTLVSLPTVSHPQRINLLSLLRGENTWQALLPDQDEVQLDDPANAGDQAN